MPYILPELRTPLEPLIEQLRQEIVRMQMDETLLNTEGVMNYIFSSLINKVYNTTNYESINDVMGLLSSVQAEFYREVAVPYENTKKDLNGPVY